MDLLNTKKVASLEEQVKDLTSKLEQMTNLYHKANDNYVASQTLNGAMKAKYEQDLATARGLGDLDNLKTAVTSEYKTEEMTDYVKKLEKEVSILLAFVKANVPNIGAYGVGKFIR